jgi:hypothetical protein
MNMAGLSQRCGRSSSSVALQANGRIPRSLRELGVEFRGSDVAGGRRCHCALSLYWTNRPVSGTLKKTASPGLAFCSWTYWYMFSESPLPTLLDAKDRTSSSMVAVEAMVLTVEKERRVKRLSGEKEM